LKKTNNQRKNSCFKGVALAQHNVVFGAEFAQASFERAVAKFP